MLSWNWNNLFIILLVPNGNYSPAPYHHIIIYTWTFINVPVAAKNVHSVTSVDKGMGVVFTNCYLAPFGIYIYLFIYFLQLVISAFSFICKTGSLL